MLVTVAESPGGPTLSVRVRPGESVSFGRGGDLAVDVVLDHPGLSRRAGFLALFEDGRISVSCYQTGGAMEVRRASGVTANRLARGEACVVAPGDYSVEVVGMAGPPLRLELRQEEGETVAGAGRAELVTEPVIRARAVLRPQAHEEWQTVLALACVRARRAPRPDGWVAPSVKQLASIVALWFGFAPSDKWLSDRLDAALDKLHLPRDGSDKLPRLVSRTLAGGLVTDALLDEVERRLGAARHG